MREMKNHFHLRLVVIRISIMVIEIFAVASAEGVKQIPIQRNLAASETCLGVRAWTCLPRPWWTDKVPQASATKTSTYSGKETSAGPLWFWSFPARRSLTKETRTTQSSAPILRMMRALTHSLTNTVIAASAVPVPKTARSSEPRSWSLKGMLNSIVRYVIIETQNLEVFVMEDGIICNNHKTHILGNRTPYGWQPSSEYVPWCGEALWRAESVVRCAIPMGRLALAASSAKMSWLKHRHIRGNHRYGYYQLAKPFPKQMQAQLRKVNRSSDLGGNPRSWQHCSSRTQCCKSIILDSERRCIAVWCRQHACRRFVVRERGIGTASHQEARNGFMLLDLSRLQYPKADID